jgi:nucleotide-binding universal stress UspA family protein
MQYRFRTSVTIERSEDMRKGSGMIGTVVVPLDGSELAERALVFGTAIAERTGAPVMLVRIARIGADEPEVAEIREYLRNTAARVSGRVQFEVERGRHADAIIKLAHEAGDPLIVMSTRGQGGIRRWMTGSVADEVVRHAGVPVLLVRGDKEMPSLDQFEIKNILLPVDGSSYSESAIDYAITIARAFDSQIHLVRVVDTPSAYAMLSRHMEVAATGDILDEILLSMRQETDQYLEETAARIRRAGVKVKPVALDGYPGEQVIEYERRGFFQLVVMATAGRSGVSRVVFGSVAERVLKLGRSPVMMIRPPEGE